MPAKASKAQPSSAPKGAKKPTPVRRKAAPVARSTLRGEPPVGVETDPNESFELKAASERDVSKYTLDKSRCVTVNEVTTQTRTASALPFVIRQFFTRPSIRSEKVGTETTNYSDARGVHMATKRSTVKVKNLCRAPIVFMATTANTPNMVKNQIGARSMLADNVQINPGQSKTFTINRMGMHPYLYEDDKGRVHEHLFDGYIRVPDVPPQDQSDLSNEITTTSDGKTVNIQRRIWSERAEIAEISIHTDYYVQPTPKDYALERVESHPAKFSVDWDVPYGHTVQTYLTPSGAITTESRGLNVQTSYDISGEGWLGMGIAYLEDVYAKTTVAYLAKFKAPEGVKKRLPGAPPPEHWEELTDEEKDAIRQKINSDYPAYRNAALEDRKLAIYLPGGAGLIYDASGDDLATVSCTFRWSDEHMAFVLWDYCRARPVFIEKGWHDPNKYQEWVACLPPKGFLIVNDPAGINSLELQAKVDERFLMPRAITWDIIILAVTTLIDIIKGIQKVSEALRRAAPQG